MLKRKRTKAELKHVAGVFFRTGVIAGVWFGITGLALNALSDRVSLQCERTEESIPECKLSIKHLLTESIVKTDNSEFQQVTSRAVANTYFPGLVSWEMTIATSQNQIYFYNYGMGESNPWQEFATRTNRFLDTPQLRSFTITAEHNFWFKLLSQSVSGISILVGLFVLPGLYLTAKYGDDAIAHQQAVERLFGQFTRQSLDSKTTDLSIKKIN